MLIESRLMSVGHMAESLLSGPCARGPGHRRLEFAIVRPKPVFQCMDGPRKAVLAERALPHNGDSPTCFEKSPLRAGVPLDIALELGAPEFGSGGGRGRVPATGMAVPETAVDEARHPMAPKDKIRGSGEIPNMESESVSVRVQRPAQRMFRLGVPVRDARHHPRPRGLVDNVDHRLCRSVVQMLINPDSTQYPRANQGGYSTEPARARYS